MTIEEQVEYWFDLAEEDLIVVESNFKSEHYLWCLFLCHLILEKALKGIFVQEVQDTHPRTYDLVKIAKQSKISLSEKDLNFLFDMNQFNIEARYPEYKSQIKKKADKNFTNERLLKT